MKKISIRTRITLWYIAMLVIFLYLGVAGSYNAMYDILTTQHSRGMSKGAQMLSQTISNAPDGEELTIFTQRSAPLPKEINYIFFDKDKTILSGQYQAWMLDIPAEFDELRIIKHDDQYWACFDSMINKNGQEFGSIRTMRDVTSTFELLDEMKQRGIIAIIPSLFLCALGGFFITYWALKPIRNIAKTAKKIGAGDLSKRIELDVANDEVGELLVEFNHMADNVQKVIEREKQFSSDASHEIRTPIAVIITNAEYAIERRDLDTCIDTLKLIIDKSQQMQQILSQLMVLARGNEQADAMEIEPLDLGNIVSDIAEERYAKVQEKYITIQTHVEKEIIVNGDLMLLSRLVTNLLDNAIQYSHVGGLITLTVSHNPAAHTAIIQVADNGIGITKDDLPFIFDRFYRVDKSRSQSGAGLGLSFVDFIVTLHHGTIAVDSQLGKGTTFTVELPLA